MTNKTMLIDRLIELTQTDKITWCANTPVSFVCKVNHNLFITLDSDGTIEMFFSDHDESIKPGVSVPLLDVVKPKAAAARIIKNENAVDTVLATLAKL